jgi:hypothetical protein
MREFFAFKKVGADGSDPLGQSFGLFISLAYDIYNLNYEVGNVKANFCQLKMIH